MAIIHMQSNFANSVMSGNSVGAYAAQTFLANFGQYDHYTQYDVDPGSLSDLVMTYPETANSPSDYHFYSFTKLTYKFDLNNTPSNLSDDYFVNLTGSFNKTVYINDYGLGPQIALTSAGSSTLKGFEVLDANGNLVFGIDHFALNISPQTLMSENWQSKLQAANAQGPEAVFSLFFGKLESVQFTSGNNVYTAGASADIIIGGSGNDQLFGSAGKDKIAGGAGDDLLDGGADADKLDGGAGDDTFVVGLTAAGKIEDKITEALDQGSDTLQLSGSSINTKVVTIKLAKTLENLDASDTGSSQLSLWGNELDNELTGNDFGNLIKGLGGNDVLDGGFGNDTLAGGLGIDVLIGNVGADIFRFDTALSAPANVDSIVDFDAAEDFIQLENSVFKMLKTTGTLSDGNFRSADGTAQDADDFILYNASNGGLYYDADGSGALAAVQFATLENTPTLSAADFVVT